MGLAPRAKAELCWWHQSSSSSGCPNDWMVFCIPCSWLWPCLGPVCSTLIPCFRYGSGTVASLVPRLEWHPWNRRCSALLPPGSPFSAAIPKFFIYNFTESNTVLKSEWKKILKIFLYGKIFSKFAKTPLKNISGWIFHLFPLSSLVCNGLGRNCLFLHLFPELQFLLSPSYCKRKASVLSECL